MHFVLAVLFGIHIVLVVYLMAFIVARGVVKGGSGIPVVLTLSKYFIYWAAISYGSRHLPPAGILIGITSGIYISLPIAYFVNKRMQDHDTGP